MNRRDRLVAVLGDGPVRWVSAPGRVNLMGDHTDYNEGFVLPVAIDRDCLVAWRPAQDGHVRVRSLELDGVCEVPADGSRLPSEVEPEWGRLIAGMVRALAAQGRPPSGLEAVLSSSVPIGAGLSSSAALEVAVGLALCEAAGFRLPPPALAAACQEAERTATGVPCGIMDQLVALQAVAGAALLIDCRSLGTRPVPLPPWLAVLAVDPGVRRTLEASGYGARRAACEQIAGAFGVPALRDLRLDQVRDAPIARHVVTENRRVLALADALANGDRSLIGRLFAESHASLRDDLSVSTPELDVLVDTLTDAGAIGARLTGAGFGGCVVAVVDQVRVAEVIRRSTVGYREATGRALEAFTCRAVAGAGVLTPWRG